MKFSTLVLLAVSLISTANSVNACVEGGGQADHAGMMSLIPDTQELNIYNSVQNLLQSRSKSMNKAFGENDPFLGLPMRYPTFPHAAAENNIALAAIHNGRPIVLWGPSAARNLGPILMGFFMQHEYAHHDLRHPIRNDIPSAVKEADADCRAAQTLVEYGMTNVIPVVVSWFASQGCNYDPRTPIQNVSDSHPCGTQRSQIISQCAGM